MKHSPLQKLNIMLDLLSQKEIEKDRKIAESTLSDSFIKIVADASYRDIKPILSKIHKDGYCQRDKKYFDEDPDEDPDEDSEFYYMYWITFEGLIFNEKGGYINENQKEIAQTRLSNRLNIMITVSGTIAAIYYILEIFKNYILPHCNCFYYTH